MTGDDCGRRVASGSRISTPRGVEFGVMTAPEILALPDRPDVPEGAVSEHVRRVEDGAVVRVVWYPDSGCETAEVVG